MGDKTGIGWTSATWNPVVGCEHVSAGCDHCYAAREASARLAHLPQYAGLARRGRFTGEVRLLPERMDQPLRWRKPRMIFANSMSDLFHKDIPDEFIARVFAVMTVAHWHTFQVLTKRHARMRSLLSSGHFVDLYVNEYENLSSDLIRISNRWSDHFDTWERRWPLPNVWLGVSVEDQHWADIRIPALLDTPAAVRFLSCEPLLGPIDLHANDDGQHHWLPDFGPVYDPPDEQLCQAHGWPDCPRVQPHAGCTWIDWVIAGGESGPGARPMHPDWARSIRDQCAAAEVPFFFKQFGEYLPVAIEDDPAMFGGRAYTNPGGGRSSPVIREHGGPFRTGTTRLMRPGDRTGAGVLLDRDTIALKVGKHKAGNELDGQVWEQFPRIAEGVPS